MSRIKHPDKREGNPRHALTPTPPPPTNLIPVEVPECPVDLGTAGSHLWAELWTFGHGAYNPRSDRHVVARYCQLTERRADMLARLDDEGWTTTGSQGQEVAHPLARMIEALEQRLVTLEDRLGLNPEARIRLNIQSENLRKSALDAFLDEE